MIMRRYHRRRHPIVPVEYGEERATNEMCSPVLTSLHNLLPPLRNRARRESWLVLFETIFGPAYDRPALLIYAVSLHRTLGMWTAARPVCEEWEGKGRHFCAANERTPVCFRPYARPSIVSLTGPLSSHCCFWV